MINTKYNKSKDIELNNENSPMIPNIIITNVEKI